MLHKIPLVYPEGFLIIFSLLSINTKETSCMRTKILKLYTGIFVIGSIYLIWLLATDTYIPCFYFITMGLLCPGCGISRMFVSLAKLDIAAAFSYNPVVFIFFAIWNLIALLCFIGKPKFVQTPKFMYTLLGFSVITLILWGFARNLY